MKSLFRAFGRKQSSPTNWAPEFFRTPLVDLGATDPRFGGILTPLPELGAEKIGISEQFLANAEIYHHSYSHGDFLVALLASAFRETRLSTMPSPDVLDIGTGSGKNSIIPMINLYPKARFIATDLSPDLLVILHRYSHNNSFSNRIACICTDAMNNYFHLERFDIVTGIAILHHLLDPFSAIRAAHAALKKHGVAVFYEPFEGHILVSMAFQRILNEAAVRTGSIDPKVADFLYAMVIDTNARRGSDKSADRFKYMDDKWLFTRTYIEEAAQRAGFRSTRIIARSTGPSTFRMHVEDNLKSGINLDPDCLPDWAWQYIDELDDSFSPEMKEDLVLTGLIVLQK